MIVAIHGPHNSGKTTFIEQLLKKLKKHRVVVIKNSHLITLDKKNSDTYRYRNAGAQASILRTKNETIFFVYDTDLDYSLFLAHKFNPDVILLEGFTDIPDHDCIMVDMEQKMEVDDVYKKILQMKEKYQIEIFAGGHRLPLNPFVQDLYYKTIKTMVSVLHEGEHKDIEIIIKE